MEIPISRPWYESLRPYLPGIVLFALALVVGLNIYQDYGVSWDEPYQRKIGEINFNYIFNGDKTLLTYHDRFYGPGYELVLIFLEKALKISDSRDIYLMRHLVGHLLFLCGCLSLYVLAYKLYRDRLVATLVMAVLLMEPRIYAHSFFNSKDIPVLALFVLALTVCRSAFGRRSSLLFLLTGLLCGYATAIRVTGVMLFMIIAFFLSLDVVMALVKKDRVGRSLASLLLFVAGFCAMLGLAWPYLWSNPIGHFAESYKVMAHYTWGGNILFFGRQVMSTSLPWTYFPGWFGISVPVLWLLCGVVGIVWLLMDAAKKPIHFMNNNCERFLIMALLCFAGPILAVILLHSVIYDDWRHLYFVFPSFALLCAYPVCKLMKTKARAPVLALCAAQCVWVYLFLSRYHPFQQVYFNELVSHNEEYLRANFELDYWGAGYKQGLDYVTMKDPKDTIKIARFFDPIPNNTMILPERDRKRIKITADSPDYLITNYRAIPFHDYDKLRLVYKVKVLNSTVLGVYKLK